MTRTALLVALTLLIILAIAFVVRPIVARGDMLASGAPAPDVTGQSVFAGKVEPFSLRDQLKHGAVVLYFFPAAFTSG